VINATLMIDGFRKQGINSFEKYDEDCLKKLLNEVNNAYHNNEPVLSDNEFDIMEQYVLFKYGKTGDSKTGVGAPVIGGKVELPYEMASMDKIKPDTMALDAWKRLFRGPYVISCKLDGVSGLYCTEQGKARLYTRGDGKFGQDISHLIPYLNLPPKMGICIRGEFIIAKNTFAEKYASTFANPRNMVAGLINHKHTDSAFYEKLRDVRFVAYEVITPSLKPSEQFCFLKQLSNIDICYHKPMHSSLLSNELLSQLLVEMRGQYIFETDGIIVSDDHAHERPVGNPEYAFAFKMALSEQMSHAKVVDVLWSASKDGYLKPRVQFEPIFLGGVKIEYATGFNAAFILQNKIGVGAVVEIIRSGDVIPHIKQVVVQATTPLLPTDCEWAWNETNVDIVVSNLCDNESVIEKTVTLFFKEIGVDGLGPGTVKKICKAGFNSIVKVVRMTKEEMAGVGGFGEKSANKICDSIAECMEKASLPTLMSASNLFGRGFGERKISPIMELFPTILLLNESKEEKVAKVLQVKGVASKSAIAFVEGIDDFNHFFSEMKGASSPSASPSSPSASSSSLEVKDHFLFKKTVVLTGFRDKELLQRLKDVGATQGTSVSKNTFAVVVKQAGETGAKIDSALKIGVPVFFLDDFNKKYFS
jgi:NAD-dependent DNA ligase